MAIKILTIEYTTFLETSDMHLSQPESCWVMANEERAYSVSEEYAEPFPHLMV
jgi:hypothetical protein